MRINTDIEGHRVWHNWGGPAHMFYLVTWSGVKSWTVAPLKLEEGQDVKEKWYCKQKLWWKVARLNVTFQSQWQWKELTHEKVNAQQRNKRKEDPQRGTRHLNHPFILCLCGIVKIPHCPWDSIKWPTMWCTHCGCMLCFPIMVYQKSAKLREHWTSDANLSQKTGVLYMLIKSSIVSMWC